MSGFLVLEDGSVFRGTSVGAEGIAFGEAVFTTAMTGYQEVVTDPSYAEQLVCFTAPMVGNYGVAPERSESETVHARAVLMRRAGGVEWTDWLAANGVVALEDVDTRTFVVRAQAGMAGRALVAGVSTCAPYTIPGGGVPVAVVDYGCKRSILTRLNACGAQATVWPHDVDAGTLLDSRPAGVLLSNGPGDPSALPQHVAVVRELLGRVPVLGICLGHQLLALAAGYATFKLPFGHRGSNHPVLDVSANRVLVTSQNHGFAVAGDGPEATHVSLYDGTVEGLSLPAESARSVQFHPEAGPGPHDAWPLLEGWVEELGYAAAA
jgi:carbamoyl-phosphate synthase small subunit